MPAPGSGSSAYAYVTYAAPAVLQQPSWRCSWSPCTCVVMCWQLCRAKPEVSEEDKKREAVRAQLEQVTQEYRAAQEQARSAAQQLK